MEGSVFKFSSNAVGNVNKPEAGRSGKTSPEKNEIELSLPYCTFLDRERLEAILENIPSAVVVMEKPDGKVTYANKRAIELHGINPFGLKIVDHVPKLKMTTLDGKAFSTEQLYTYKTLRSGETTRNAPLVIEHLSGRRIIVSVSVQPLYDNNGEVAAAVAIFDDVTERLKTEQALRESESRLKMAQNIAHVGNWEYYIKEDRAVWSEELFRIFGLPLQPFGPNFNTYLSRIHPDDRQRMQDQMQKMVAEGEVVSNSFDYRIVLDDGSIRVIHSERMVYLNENKQAERVIGVEQDITER